MKNLKEIGYYELFRVKAIVSEGRKEIISKRLEEGGYKFTIKDVCLGFYTFKIETYFEHATALDRLLRQE